MTKNELIDAVVDKTRTSKVTAASAVDATFDIMTATLKQGDEVMITGFGKFTVVERAARDGHDPRTGAWSGLPPPGGCASPPARGSEKPSTARRMAPRANTPRRRGSPVPDGCSHRFNSS